MHDLTNARSAVSCDRDDGRSVHMSGLLNLETKLGGETQKPCRSCWPMPRTSFLRIDTKAAVALRGGGGFQPSALHVVVSAPV